MAGDPGHRPDFSEIVMLGHHPSVLSRFQYLKNLVAEAENDVNRSDIYQDALKRIKTTVDELLNFDKKPSGPVYRGEQLDGHNA